MQLFSQLASVVITDETVQLAQAVLKGGEHVLLCGTQLAELLLQRAGLEEPTLQQAEVAHV